MFVSAGICSAQSWHPLPQFVRIGVRVSPRFEAGTPIRRPPGRTKRTSADMRGACAPPKVPHNGPTSVGPRHIGELPPRTLLWLTNRSPISSRRQQSSVPRSAPVPPVHCAFRRSRPPIPTDRDHLFRSIATSVARVLTAPLDDSGDVSLLKVGQARREAVPVVNRRDPRATRSALTAGAAARAGGPC